MNEKEVQRELIPVENLNYEFAVFSRHQIVVMLFDCYGEIYQIIDNKDLILVHTFHIHPDDFDRCSSFNKMILPIGRDFIGISLLEDMVIPEYFV